jgi:hypothetical protein
MYLGPPMKVAPGRDATVGSVKAAWRWLGGGVLAIAIGLALWWTAFILVPVGVVLIAVGATKLVGRMSGQASPSS